MTITDVTDKIARDIKRQFSNLLEKSGCSFLLEKPPTNCLRIPFLNKIYPGAKIVFILRDGRSVIRSTIEMRKSPPVPLRRSVWVRMKDTPIHQWPSYFNKIGLFYERFLNRSPKFWGPRPPGWKDWLEKDTVEEIVARQWVATANTAYNDLRRLEIDHFFIKYEDLVNRPAELVQGIFEYCELDYSQEVLDYILAYADSSKADYKKGQLGEEILNTIEPIMAETNRKFGYGW